MGSTGHGHGHVHGATAVVGTSRGRLAIALGIAVVILAVELVGAAVTGSLALLADAGHMLTDVAGLALALLAATLAARPATARRTWGYLRAEVLAAAAQAAVLLAVGIYVLMEAVRRLFHPQSVEGEPMIVFAVVGLVGNGLAIAVLATARRENLNTRAAFLEVVNDALASCAVLVAAVTIAVTGWLRADALASLLIGALILPRTWRLLRETVDVLLESTPRGVDLDEVRAHIRDGPHVLGIHDVHASTVATGLPVLTAHVVVDDACFHDGHIPQLLDQLQNCLDGHFDVGHSTFQFEPIGHAAHEHERHP